MDRTDGAACLRLSVWDDFTDKLVCPHAEEMFHHTTSCQASPPRGKLSLLLLMTLFDTVSMCIKRVGLPTNICTQLRRHFPPEFIRPWNLEWVILKVCGGETKQHILLCDPDLWCHRGWSEFSKLFVSLFQWSVPNFCSNTWMQSATFTWMFPVFPPVKSCVMGDEASHFSTAVFLVVLFFLPSHCYCLIKSWLFWLHNASLLSTITITQPDGGSPLICSEKQ